jgi:surface-adhesin protein E
MPFTIRPFRRFLPLGYCSGFLSLITLLLLSSGLAYAEWVAVSSKDLGDVTVYANPDTIRRNGDLVKMWQLSDFTTVQTVEGDSYLSSKAEREYDCAEERTRVLAFTWFSANMGSGNVVYSNSNERNWEPFAPHSLDEALWEVACTKR